MCNDKPVYVEVDMNSIEETAIDSLTEVDESEDLWDADPNCGHDIQPAPFGGGIRCTKCRGWFCY